MAAADDSTRLCKTCKAEKSLAEFGRRAAEKDGINPLCRQCHRDRMKAFRATPKAKSWRAEYEVANAAKHRRMARARRAAKPEQYRGAERRRYAAKIELYRSTARAWLKKSRLADPEKFRAKARAYYAKNPAIWKQARDRYLARRASNGGKHTQADIREIFRLQRGRCAYCRVTLAGKRSRYTVDHIIPLAAGGTNNRRNLQITCRPCNGKKNATDPINFARKLGRLL